LFACPGIGIEIAPDGTGIGTGTEETETGTEETETGTERTGTKTEETGTSLAERGETATAAHEKAEAERTAEEGREREGEIEIGIETGEEIVSEIAAGTQSGAVKMRIDSALGGSRGIVTEVIGVTEVAAETRGLIAMVTRWIVMAAVAKRGSPEVAGMARNKVRRGEQLVLV
jgi:hypothetical protein